MASRFAQRNEEEHILTLEGDGRYLDLGSYDGKTFSNVRALAERGWKGVCVEPASHAFSAMLNDPPPGAKLIHAAVAPRTGLISFHESRDAVSSTSRAHVRKWKEHVRFKQTFTVGISVGDLLSDFPGPYRFISIDTEGTSMWLFREMAGLLDKLETEMVCVEHDGEKPHLDGWESVYRSAENEILRRR